MLFVSTTDGGFKSIAQATNHTLTITADTVDVSTKDIHAGQWTASDVNMLSWSCSSENLVCDDPQGISYEDLVEIMISRTPVYGVFGYFGNKDAGTDSVTGDISVPDGGWVPKSTDGLKGKMMITNLVKNAPIGDNASFTVDFTGLGPLVKFSATGTVLSGPGTPVTTKASTTAASTTKA